MVKQNSNNGTTLRTRIVRDKTKYNRKQKHKKSFAEAGDFSFIFPFIFHLNHFAISSNTSPFISEEYCM